MSKKITEERIEEVVNNAFIKANENIALDYANNLKEFEDIAKNYEYLKGYEPSLCGMATARNVCFSAFKEALKELFCDN